MSHSCETVGGGVAISDALFWVFGLPGWGLGYRLEPLAYRLETMNYSGLAKIRSQHCWLPTWKVRVPASVKPLRR